MRQKENRKCERCCKPPCDCLLFGCFFCRNKSVLCKQSYVNWATVPAQSTILCLYHSAHSRQVGTTWIPFWIKAVYDSMILIYDSRRWGSHFQVVALLNCYVLLWEWVCFERWAKTKESRDKSWSAALCSFNLLLSNSSKTGQRAICTV